MIAIRSYLPSLLTFPGVILRQCFHGTLCRMLKVRILDIRYFRADTPSGYVLHEMPKSLGVAVLLAIGPLILHSLVCMAICLPAMIPILFYDQAVDGLTLFQMWVGLSIGMHAFPPFRDVNNLWELTRKEALGHGVLVRIVFPLLAFFRTAQRLSLFGFDVAYAAVIGIGLPWLVLGKFISTP